MKLLKITPLLLSLCLAILPATLRADNKTVTESDVETPISLNKGDTITFAFQGASWDCNMLTPVYSDATILANDSTATLLSWSSTTTHRASAGESLSLVFDATNSGQQVVIFQQLGADPVFKYTKAVTFIINIQ